MKKTATVLALLALSGCGSDTTELTVSAATSLKTALPKYEPHARYSFAGSDQLAAQIRTGARPDVFAAANTKLPEELFKQGLVERPKVFATNTLVMVVPAGTDKIDALGDLGRPGVKIAVGAPDVPVGSYTREVLARLPSGEEQKIMDNVRSNEPDVKGVIGKLTQGAADAGFVYRTDLVDGLKAVTLPQDLQPVVEYGAGVVKGAKHADTAQQYLDGLTSGPCADALRSAGFGSP